VISVSKSSIDRYLQCPARYWRERIAPPELRRKEPVTGPLIVGRAVHTVIELLVRNARLARRTGIDNDLTRSRQLANIGRQYDGAVTDEIAGEPTIDWGRNGKDAETAGGFGALQALAAAVITLPISGEEVPFSIAIAPDVQLTGRVDAILEDGRLVDFKTQTPSKFSPWRWTAAKARTDFQPPMYAAGILQELGYIPKTFTFIVAEKAPGAVVETYPVSLTPAHVAWARVTALLVARAIAAGIFPMPNGAPCNRCFLKNEGGCKAL
jgi:hypothetical protein